MTEFIVGGVVVVVLLVVVWLRFRAGRSDRRSMETYGHALGVLGSVAKRTGPSASVRVLPPAEPGQAHVRTGGAGAVSPPRAYHRPPPSIPTPERGLSFEDRGGQWAGAGRPAVREPGERVAPRDRPHNEPGDAGPGDLHLRARREPARPLRPSEARPEGLRAKSAPHGPDPAASPAASGATAEPRLVPEPARLPSSSPDELRRQAAVRRLATGAFALLAVIAIVLGAIQLLTGPPQAGKAPPTTHSHSSTSTSAPSTTVARTTTTRPDVIAPISSSGNEVTYSVSAAHYLLTFATSGQPCWVGVETGVGSGNFVWTGAVQPGSNASYHASGSLVVNVGAAEYLSVRVNGVPIRIPGDLSTGYLSFVSH